MCQNLLFQSWLERCFDDPLADLGTGFGQRADIADIHARQTVFDPFRQRFSAIGAVCQKIAVCLRCRGETARNPDAFFL